MPWSAKAGGIAECSTWSMELYIPSQAKALADLANDPDVKYISVDHALKAESLTPDYKLQAVNADIAQTNGFNGAGVGVAILDSGITNRPDFVRSQLQSVPSRPRGEHHE